MTIPPIWQPTGYDQSRNEYTSDILTVFIQAFYLLIDFYGGATSAITQVSPDATSYAHRSTVFKMQFLDQVISADPYPDDGFDLLNGWVDAIAAAQGVDAEELGMYANYADSSLSAEQAHRGYWGDNYERLSELKGVFDPGRVFMNPQGIDSESTSSI